MDPGGRFVGPMVRCVRFPACAATAVSGSGACTWRGPWTHLPLTDARVVLKHARVPHLDAQVAFFYHGCSVDTHDNPKSSQVSVGELVVQTLVLDQLRLENLLCLVEAFQSLDFKFLLLDNARHFLHLLFGLPANGQVKN